MLLFFITILSVSKIGGHYCDSRECPGFSLIKTVKISSVSSQSLEITWSSKENFTIERYEVHWYSPYKCDTCSGQWSSHNTTTFKLNVLACKLYFFEVYAIEVNSTITAPGLISQITAADPLQNGTAVRISGRWAILRWVQFCDCPNSTFLAVCYGPTIITQIKPYHPDRVVIYNMSILKENSSYVCVSYTVNSAGSSLPSWPIFFTTIEDTFGNHDEKGSLFGYTLVVILITVAVFIMLTVILMYFTSSAILKLPWRRSYDVTQTSI